MHNNELNPFLNLSSDLHCYICSFLLGELFNNIQERNEYKLTFSTTRKSHLWFSHSGNSDSSLNNSNNSTRYFTNSDNGVGAADDRQRFYLNSPLKLNGMIMLLSLKNSCRRMNEFVRESEQLWHSILISFPLSLGFKSGRNVSRMMNSKVFSKLDGDRIDLMKREDMVDDVLNILFMLNKLCSVKKVIKRISIDFTLKSLLSGMNSRLEQLNIMQTTDNTPLFSLLSLIFENLEELILLPSNCKDTAMTIALDMSYPFKKLKHLVIDADINQSLVFIKKHISTLEDITFVNKGSNFKTIYAILDGLLNSEIIQSEALNSVEFVGPVDFKYLATIQFEYVKKHGSNAAKYLSKIKNLSVFQFTCEADLGHESNRVLTSNMVELTLVQYQGGDSLDLSNMDFPNLKILNIKGCMQTLNLKGMDARLLESLQMRMFDVSGASPSFYGLKYLTIDNCKGIEVTSWFNSHENLRVFRVIPNKWGSSLEGMEMILSNHRNIRSIIVTGCDDITISECRNLEEIHLFDCKSTTISTTFEDFNRGLKTLEIENSYTNSKVTLDISYCYLVDFRNIGFLNFTFNQPLRIHHFQVSSWNLFQSISNNLEISNIYITSISSDQISSIVSKAKISNRFGITHLSSDYKPLTQFECISNDETMSIVSNAINHNRETFYGLENLYCIANNHTTDFGNISLIALDGYYYSSLHDTPKFKSNLFQNLSYISVSSNISELQLELNDLPNLKELFSASGKTTISANQITHNSIRSIMILSYYDISIKFNGLKARYLVNFFVIDNCTGTRLEELKPATRIVEIENCQFPSLIFHSPIVKDQFVDEKVKSLEKLLKNVRGKIQVSTNENKTGCKLM